MTASAECAVRSLSTACIGSIEGFGTEQGRQGKCCCRVCQNKHYSEDMASTQKRCSSLDPCPHNSCFSMGRHCVGPGTCIERAATSRMEAKWFKQHAAGLPPNGNCDRCAVCPQSSLRYFNVSSLWPHCSATSRIKINP